MKYTTPNPGPHIQLHVQNVCISFRPTEDWTHFKIDELRLQMTGCEYMYNLKKQRLFSFRCSYSLSELWSVSEFVNAGVTLNFDPVKMTPGFIILMILTLKNDVQQSPVGQGFLRVWNRFKHP